jgi:hypothetical protein
MRVLVCGGRDFHDIALLVRVLDALHLRFHFSSLVHGGARGADQYAGKWARGVLGARNVKVFEADWDRHGPNAGAFRNQRMLDEGQPALVVAFPGGAGTRDMVRRALRAGIRTLRVKEDGTLAEG